MASWCRWRHRSGPTSAETDETDFDRIAACDLGAQLDREGGGGSDDSGTRDETAAGNVFFFGLDGITHGFWDFWMKK